MQSKTFTDFDAFVDSVKDLIASMMFHNVKQHSWTINHAWLPTLHLQFGILGSGNVVEGQTCSDGVVLYLPLTGDCEYRVNGILKPKGSIAILEPSREVCIASTAEHDWCSVQIPVDMFAKIAPEGPAIRKTPPRSASLADRQLANRISNLISQVMSSAAKYPGYESTLAARNVEAELLKAAAEVIGRPLKSQQAKHHHDGRSPLPRDEIIRRCKILLDERHAEPIRVDDMLDVAQVSPSTLRRAFKDYFGIGPKRYLQLRQLHQVHRALMRSDPQATKVIDVLLGHGVFELGRFANKYLTLFGELPSETLKAKVG